MNQTDFILIVDDNPDNLSVLAQMLKGAGYPVRVAIDGETAIEQIELECPALILLDVMMPGIDGFETCRKITSMPDCMDVPIIFMTALSDSHKKAEGLGLGAVDYITKPFEDVEVLARIKTHLKIHELMQSMQQQNKQLADEITKRQCAESQLKAFNQELEGRIKVETAALTEATDNLQQAQEQVEKSEKLSALGELVAGVAHEINNPIGCITNNVIFISEYGEQLLDHIALYQKLVNEGFKFVQSAGQTVEGDALEGDALEGDAFAQSLPERIAAHAKEIELDYIAEDFPKLMASMQTSGDRITAISQSLRTFARADKARKQAYQLREGIEGTLLILRHRIKADGNRSGITIRTNYVDLPAIQCYPGQINQVFMNIIANAIDAMEEAHAPSGAPEIAIETVLAGNQVGIKITDNAGGMSEAVRSRIFERQFTTKKAGKGTGLGLSIAHKIVTETHGGTIECTSTVGTGTTFRITLPVGEPSAL